MYVITLPETNLVPWTNRLTNCWQGTGWRDSSGHPRQGSQEKARGDWEFSFSTIRFFNPLMLLDTSRIHIYLHDLVNVYLFSISGLEADGSDFRITETHANKGYLITSPQALFGQTIWERTSSPEKADKKHTLALPCSFNVTCGQKTRILTGLHMMDSKKISPRRSQNLLNATAKLPVRIQSTVL